MQEQQEPDLLKLEIKILTWKGHQFSSGNSKVLSTDKYRYDIRVL